MMYSSWSSNSRGLSVWSTPPMPTTPNQAARWRSWFIASVATRSPGSNAEPLERLRHAARVVRELRPVGADDRAVGARGDDFARRHARARHGPSAA